AALRQERQNQSEQNPTGGERAPLRPIQDAVISLEVLLSAEADHAQAGGDSPFPRRKDRPEQQDFGVRPDRFGKERREAYNQAQQFGRQCRHRKDLFWRRFLSQLTRPAVTFSKIQNG